MTRDTASAALQPVINSMISAQSTHEVWSTYADALTNLGFDKLLYGGTRIPTEAGKLGDIRDALIQQRGPQSYADVYLGSYNWAANNRGFASWAEAARSFTGQPRPEHLRLLQLNAQHGIKAGYVGSLNDTVRGMHGVIGLSPVEPLDQPETDELWAKVGTEIEMLSNLLQLRIASLPMAGTRRPLTSRQREALHWFAHGKTMQDIADIMDLSAATIEKHLRMA